MRLGAYCNPNECFLGLDSGREKILGLEHLVGRRVDSSPTALAAFCTLFQEEDSLVARQGATYV
jgi:hypothetical protein